MIRCLETDCITPVNLYTWLDYSVWKLIGQRLTASLGAVILALLAANYLRGQDGGARPLSKQSSIFRVQGYFRVDVEDEGWDWA